MRGRYGRVREQAAKATMPIRPGLTECAQAGAPGQPGGRTRQVARTWRSGSETLARRPHSIQKFVALALQDRNAPNAIVEFALQDNEFLILKFSFVDGVFL